MQCPSQVMAPALCQGSQQYHNAPSLLLAAACASVAVITSTAQTRKLCHTTLHVHDVTGKDITPVPSGPL